MVKTFKYYDITFYYIITYKSIAEVYQNDRRKMYEM